MLLTSTVQVAFGIRICSLLLHLCCSICYVCVCACNSGLLSIAVTDRQGAGAVPLKCPSLRKLTFYYKKRVTLHSIKMCTQLKQMQDATFFFFFGQLIICHLLWCWQQLPIHLHSSSFDAPHSYRKRWFLVFFLNSIQLAGNWMVSLEDTVNYSCQNYWLIC